MPLHLETDFERRFALSYRWPDGSGGAVLISHRHTDDDGSPVVAMAGAIPGVEALSVDDREGWSRDDDAGCYLKAFPDLRNAFRVACAALQLDAAERFRLLVQLGRADLAPTERERAAVAEILADQAARIDAFAASVAEARAAALENARRRRRAAFAAVAEPRPRR